MSPIPIRKVKDLDQIESQFNQDELMRLIPMIPMNTLMYLQEGLNDNKEEKEAVKKIWMNSQDIENNKIRLNSEIPSETVAFLKTRGLIRGDGNVFEFTSSGKKVLRKSILDDEECSFCKQASKQMISKNSYDFGNEVLVRVKNSKKFGTKYISVPRKLFANRKVTPKVPDYNIATRKNNGEFKTINDYSDEELISVLHIAKRIIKNASKISREMGRTVPVNRIKAFSEIIMSKLNEEI
jgi:hypothetical protein